MAELSEALNNPEERQHAATALRALISKIVLTPGPERGETYVTLHGEFVTILEWVSRQAVGKTAKTNTPRGDLTGVLESMVAGAGFEPATFRL